MSPLFRRTVRVLMALGSAALPLAWAAAALAQAPRDSRLVAVSDLIGASPAEVRERIGARTPDHDYVSELRQTPDGELTIRSSQDMTHGGGLCASRSVLWFRQTGEGPRNIFPRFAFRDGRLQDVLPQTGDGAMPADEALNLACVAAQGPPVSVEDAAEGVLGWAIFGPFLAATAVARTPETLGRAGARAELAKLRLGETPPGGLMAYATAPPTNVQVHMRGTEDAVITVDLGREWTHDPALVQVEVAEGRVVSIAKTPLNFVPCWVEADHALHCGATAAPL